MSLRLSEVVNQYKDWTRPWNFYSYIIKSNKLSQEELQQFEMIWCSAMGSNSWMAGDICASAKIVLNELKEKYSFVDSSVLDSVVRSVSYLMWK